MERNRSRGQAGSPPAAGQGAAGVDPAEFAEYLRAERERRRLTLQQVAEETKISSRHLAALERGDVRNWPGGMYRRAMMRAYAESIGVDREFALRQFEQAFEAPGDSEPIPPAAPARRRLPTGLPTAWRPTRRHGLAAGAALLGLAAVAVVWNVAGSLATDEAGMEAAGRVLAAPAPEVEAQPIRRTASQLEPPAVAAAAPAVDAAISPGDVAATTGSIDRAPAAAAGTLLVTSQPAGARVTVNGIGWGETPVTIRHLEFGDKRVRLTLQGYLSQERVVHVGPSQPTARVRLTLREREES